jgi:hypothetical protein
MVASPRGFFGALSAVADFDRDGRDDLATIIYQSESSLSIVILFSEGNGAFRTPVAVSAAINPVSMMAMDFDEDGRPDLLVADASDGTLKVLRNKPADPAGAPQTSAPQIRAVRE